jgi:dolichyl-phosphate-mannose--protein O-mannosyl transferase
MIFVATSTAAAINPDTVGPGQIPALIEMMAQAFNSGSWTLASGLLLTLVVVGLRLFSVTKRVSKEWMPWLVSGISLLTSIALGLQTGQGWWEIATTGLAVALVAVGGWETIAKTAKRFMTKRGWLKEPPVIAPPEE